MKIQLAMALFSIAGFTSAQEVKPGHLSPGATPGTYVVALDGKTGGNIKRSELAGDAKLQVMYFSGKEMIGDTTQKVVQFKMALFSTDRDPEPDKFSVGTALTDEMKALITTHKAGTKIYFENIQISTNVSGSEARRAMRPLSFTLTEN